MDMPVGDGLEGDVHEHMWSTVLGLGAQAGTLTKGIRAWGLPPKLWEYMLMLSCPVELVTTVSVLDMAGVKHVLVGAFPGAYACHQAWRDRRRNRS